MKGIRSESTQGYSAVLKMSLDTPQENLETIYHSLTRTADDKKNVYPDRRSVKRLRGLLALLLTLFMAMNGLLTYGIVEYQRTTNVTANQKCSVSVPLSSVYNNTFVKENCSLPVNLSLTAHSFHCQGVIAIVRFQKSVKVESIRLTESELITLCHGVI